MLTGGLFRVVAYLALGIGCGVALRRGAERWRVLAIAVFGVYAVEALKLTLFPLSIDGSYPGQPIGALVNLVPFRGLLDGDVATRQAVQNVLLGIPFGFGLWWVLPRQTNTRVMLLGLAAFAAVELVQLGTGLAGWSIARAADINDLILNLTGVVLGMVTFHLFAAAFRSLDRRPGTSGSLRAYLRDVTGSEPA